MSNNQMVLAPRELLERLDLGKNTAVAMAALPELRELLAKPAEQHQGEPVALPERRDEMTADWRDDPGAVQWNACLDEIAKLGPLYTRPAQGEPAFWMYEMDGHMGPHVYTKTRWRECKEPFTETALYTRADPAEVGEIKKHNAELLGEVDTLTAEVERLRAENQSLRKTLPNSTTELVDLRAQLAEAQQQYRDELGKRLAGEVKSEAKLAERDALLRKLAADPGGSIRHYINSIDAALSASAEPRPVIAWHVGGNGYDRICFEKPDDLPGRPCIQAIHDQRQLIDLLKRYDLRDEDVPPDERGHGIPGTSFQRLNALANEGE
ncbi:coiled-coil domain-containing protein [Pseudomonas sp. 1121_17]|uniref:coiled-coil domain-containing protein n=1 Tax=Pseudomonas sp. 1121_17 TaxID=2604458 RepID=UPI0040639AAC